MEEKPDSGIWSTSRRTYDPGDRAGKWGAEWGGGIWCGVGAEGRAGVNSRAVKEDGGILGGVKKRAHKISNRF